MINILMGLLFAVWRRIYGEGSLKGAIGNRFFQSIAGIFLCFPFFLKYVEFPFNIYFSLAISCWLIFQFWSRAIGEVLDCGESTTQKASAYGRWFRIPLDWIYDKLGKQKYTGYYDWWYMLVRYTLPLIPLCFLNINYIWAGILSSPIYWLCKFLFRKGILPRTHSVWFDDYKNYAEVVHGFVFGLCVGI